MRFVTINGKEYKFAYNLGASLIDEEINAGVTSNTRRAVGLVVACCYGGDPNCTVSMDEVMNISSMEEVVGLINAAREEQAKFFGNALDSVVAESGMASESQKSADADGGEPEGN